MVLFEERGTGEHLGFLVDIKTPAVLRKRRVQNSSEAEFLLLLLFLANHVHVAVLPHALPQFNGTTADILPWANEQKQRHLDNFYCRLQPRAETLTVHLSHGSHVVVWILEADKAVTFGLACPFVSHHLVTNTILKSFLPCTRFLWQQDVPQQFVCWGILELGYCEQGKGTLALRKDGYLLKALASMSSLTSFPRSPQKIRKSSVTAENSVRKGSMRCRGLPDK